MLVWLLFPLSGAVQLRQGQLVRVSFDGWRALLTETMSCEEGVILAGDGQMLIEHDTKCKIHDTYGATCDFQVTVDRIEDGVFRPDPLNCGVGVTVWLAVACVGLTLLVRLSIPRKTDAGGLHSILTVNFLGDKSRLRKKKRGDPFVEEDLRDLALNPDVACVIQMDSHCD